MDKLSIGQNVRVTQDYWDQHGDGERFIAVPAGAKGRVTDARFGSCALVFFDYGQNVVGAALPGQKTEWFIPKSYLMASE